MTKEEALKQIDELKKFVEEYDKVEPNIVTKFPTKGCYRGEINGEWAFTLYAKEEQCGGSPGSLVSGHKSSLFLCFGSGTWFTDDGTPISGYLFYKPNDR